MRRLLFFALPVFLAGALPAFGVNTTDLGSLTPSELAQTLVGVGVQVSNVSFTGATAAAGTFSGGSGDGLPIEQGVILSSGNIASASGPNEADNTTTDLGTAGDTDLDALVQFGTFDAVVLEFDFVPVSDELAFRYVFASEEYNEFVGSPFNDVFAFFLDNENIALVPGTAEPVAINSINLFSHGDLFVDNDPGLDGGAGESPSIPTPFRTQFDGFTVELEANAFVTPFVPHHIKLVIADTADARFDSTVFIAQGTFSSTGESLVSPDGGAPTVATDLSGKRLVAWRVSEGDGRGLWGRLFDDDGFPLGEAFRLDPAGSSQWTEPSVSFDPSGNFIVAWTASVASGPGSLASSSGVFARPFAPGGQPKGDPVRVDDGAGEPSAPSVSTSADGSFAVSWKKDPPVGLAATANNSGIFGRRFDSDGEPEGGEIPLGSAEDTDVDPPRIAVTPSGEAVAVWRRRGGGQGGFGAQADSSGIFGQWVDSSGDPDGDPFPIDAGDDVDPSEVDVDTDGRGNFVAVWSAGDQGNRRARGRRFRRGGQPQGAPFDLAPTSGRGSQSAPSVSVNGLGDIAVAMHDEVGVSGRFFPADGGATGTDIEVVDAEAGESLGNPVAGLDNQGEVTVVYSRSGGTRPGVYSRIAQPQSTGGGCNRSATTMCLQGDRFSVTASWEKPDGETGLGQAIALTDDTGTFWFFRNTNQELLLKVLDGTAANGYYWVFFGALSNVEYTVTVTDTVTGSSATYVNPQGNLASVADTSAIPQGPDGATAPQHRRVEVPPSGIGNFQIAPLAPVGAPQAGGSCVSSDQVLCLGDGRFALSADWAIPSGATGVATAAPLTTLTGNFWFFNEANLELMVKILDGTPLNGHYWVFYGALSDVAYTLTVTDTVTSATKVYPNPQGNLGSVADTTALPGD